MKQKNTKRKLYYENIKRNWPKSKLVIFIIYFLEKGIMIQLFNIKKKIIKKKK